MIELKRIVCPTDFSPTSSQAVDYAATLAEQFGAELILLHVVPEMTYPLRSFGMAASFPNLHEELHDRARGALQQAAEQLEQKLKAVSVRIDIRDGEAHEATLECANDQQADMIVMGTHGHTGLTHALLGSTAEKIVRTAPCPVLTVRSQ